MSGMWVAVTAEYDGATFSHRASVSSYHPNRDKALRDYNRLLDEAGGCVRSGLAGWLGPQSPLVSSETPVGTYHPPLSDREKLRAIEKIMADYNDDEAILAIEAVLKR